ncbi:uncharacterized protein [Drosophila takahashii]|uniref:uncharacterized protein n=1 Tax=Drosophila takahashii TaxID=29030 RepID=UPI003899040D
MFAMARLVTSTTCTRLLYAREAPFHISRPYKKLWNILPQNNWLFCRDLCDLKTKSICYKYPFRRRFSDKISEKGRGDELNYFLKLAREQFMKIKKNRMKEIASDIEKLEDDIKAIEKQTSRRSQKNRELILKEIEDLKAMLQRFKKSL